MKHQREVSIAVAAAALVMMAGSSAALATIEASMCVNYNDPDELVIMTDGDAGRQMKVSRGDSKLTKDKFRKSTKDLGFTGSSHTVSPWSASGPWPPGVYSFKGKDADDVVMETTATLSACVAEASQIATVDGIDVADITDKVNVEPDGKCIAFQGNDIEFDEVGDESSCDVDHYVLTLECDGSPPFSEQVQPDGDELGDGGADPDDFSVSVPEKFWGDDDGKECTVQVTVVMDNCNSIKSDMVTFITCEVEE